MNGVERLMPGAAVEVRRRKQQGGAKPSDVWEPGAKFSHYAGNKTVVEWPERRIEKLDHADVRPFKGDA